MHYCSGRPGSVRIAAADAAATGMVVLQIGDDGPGIPAEARQHLFEPFFTTRSDGTGLGLYLARETARLHGGDVLVTSTPGGGSTFTMVLPLV